MSFEYLIWLRDHGFAQFLHEVNDERETSGCYWERFGVRHQGIDWWFGWRRNTLMEWTTPAVLDFWRRCKQR